MLLCLFFYILNIVFFISSSIGTVNPDKGDGFQKFVLKNQVCLKFGFTFLTNLLGKNNQQPNHCTTNLQGIILIVLPLTSHINDQFNSLLPMPETPGGSNVLILFEPPIRHISGS